ncbi:MAG: MFS transporter [Lentisphaeria bacterium]
MPNAEHAAAIRRSERRFFFVYMALFAPFAVLTPYMQQLLHFYGFRKDQIGYILGALELMAVLAPPVWGLLSDRIKRPRAVLAFTVLMSFPAFCLFRGANTTIAAIGVALLFGFFNRPAIPLTDGLTFSHFRISGADYGHVRIGGTVGFVLFNLLFESVLHISRDQDGSRIVAILGGALLLQFLTVFMVPPLPKAKEGEGGDASSGADQASSAQTQAPFGELVRLCLTRGFIAFVFAAFLARFAMMSYYSFFTRYLNEVYDFKAVGYIWLLGSLCEMPLIFWSRQIMARIGVRNLFALALLGTFFRLLGFSFESNLWVVMAMQPLHALTFGAYHCATVTYVSSIFPAHFQGSAQTIYSALTVGLGGLLGSAVCGVVLEHHGYQVMYSFAAAVALIGLAVCIFQVPKLDDMRRKVGQG